ncbi:MAG: hypothetical protein J6L69_08635 [Lachnospiraceae bacterium]|nr:hypothetical protein [Lachnospiraceae bacterium]
MLRFNKTKMFLSIYLFCFIYAPPVIKVNFIYIVAAWAYVLLTLKYKDVVTKLLKNKKVFFFNLGIMCVLGYYIVMAILDNLYFKSGVQFQNYLMVMYRFFTILFVIEPVVIYIIAFAKKRKLMIKDIIECIIYAGLIESGFSILCLISPTIKLQLNTIMFANASSKDITEMALWQYNGRYYGFSEVLVDLFGFGSGIIAGICMLYGYYVDSKFYKFFPFLFIMTAINAITGVIIIGVAVFFVIINSRLNKKRICTILSAPLVIICMFFIMNAVAPNALNRLINNFWAVFDSTKVTTLVTSVDILFNEKFWNLPENWYQIIFGTGHSVYGAQNFGHSDVGYINNIWSFGLVGSSMLYITYYKFIMKTKENLSNVYQKTQLYLFIALMVFEIKAVGIGCNPGNVVIILLIFVINFLDKKEVCE